MLVICHFINNSLMNRSRWDLCLAIRKAKGTLSYQRLAIFLGFVTKLGEGLTHGKGLYTYRLQVEGYHDLW